MQTEIKVRSSDQFLICNYVFSEGLLENVKRDVTNIMSDKIKDDKYYEFINWERTKNEIAVLTKYSFADILLPKRYDTVFQIDKSENYIHTEFEITQAIINGWAPMGQITQGHKHIVIIRFTESVGDIFNLLSDFNNNDSKNEQVQLGLCKKDDFFQLVL